MSADSFSSVIQNESQKVDETQYCPNTLNEKSTISKKNVSKLSFFMK
jgi:hypothetical protein